MTATPHAAGKPYGPVFAAEPLTPRAAGPRNGLPEPAFYVHQPKPAPAGAEDEAHVLSSSVAEDFAMGYGQCPECGARPAVGKTVGVTHDAGCCFVAKLVRQLLARGAAA